MHKLLLVSGIAGIFTFGEISGTDFSQPAKKSLVCPVQVDEALLQNLGMRFLKEWMFLLPIREQIEKLSHGQKLFVFLLEKSVLHHKCLVPDKTTAPCELGKPLLIFVPEFESKFIALAYYHVSHYTFSLWRRQGFWG